MDFEKIGLTIKVITIEKLEPPKNLAIKVDFKGNNIRCSHIITSESSETEVNWEVFYEVPEITESVVDDLIANPFVFTVLQEGSSILPVDKTKKAAKNKKKNTQSKGSPSKSSSRTKEFSVESVSTKSKTTKYSESKSITDDLSCVKNIESFGVLGVANLDILPLLRGKDEISEMLLLHPLDDLRGSRAVTWTNLPWMEVTVTSTGTCSKTLSERVSNIIFFTVESLYNLTPTFLNGDVQIATVIPRSEDFEVIKFVNSSVETDVGQSYKKKKWCNLSGMPGQAALSSYKISEDSLEVSMEHKITNEVLLNRPRVQWNQLRRRIFTDKSQEEFKRKLITHRCWPLEIVILNSVEKKLNKMETKSEKGSAGGNKSSEAISGDNKHFIVFLDVSKLLYPGVTSCRVASQLYFYQYGLMESRFGSDHKMFELAPVPSVVKVNKSARSVSSNKDSSKQTSPKSKKREKVVIEEMAQEEPKLPMQPMEPEPVLNNEGEPIFIIVQLELLSPLIEKKSTEEVLRSIQSIIPKRPQPTAAQQAALTSIESFETSIKQLMTVIFNEYQIFFSENERVSLLSVAKNFLMHLHMTGTYTKMKETIQDSLKSYIEGAIGPLQGLDSTRLDYQEVLSHIYLTMVRKMCDVVNMSLSQVTEYDPDVPYDDVLYFALEAMEEEMPEKAQQYLLQRLERSKKADPEAWVDYAKFWLKKQEFEKAGECVRESISIDPKNIRALFFQGLLSWLTEDFEVAEMFLLAVSSLNPFLLEVWVVLHMFHRQMDNQLSAKVELEYARKSDNNEESCEVKADPILSWSSSLTDPQRVFLITAILLLRLTFPELAEVALSYDLLEHGRSIDYLYYLAVCHYMQGRYTDSIKHLEEALKADWEDGRLWTLKGHNYYKIQNYSEAKHAFDFALNFTLSQSDTCLINLRLGNIFYGEDEFEKAQKYFLDVCQVHGSPLSWQGLGITTFMIDNLEDAELAFNEANLLDCRQPQVWGYLALINLMWARPAVYNMCMSQAIRHGLNDPVLLERLNVLGKFVQPTHI